MSEEPEEKTLIMFGRDVSKIPCFRNSFLYGTLGGLSLGLTYFMFTSKVGRYDYSKTKFEMMRLQEVMRDRTILDGSELEKKLSEQPEIVEV